MGFWSANIYRDITRFAQLRQRTSVSGVPKVFKVTKEAVPDVPHSYMSRASVRATTPTCGYCKKRGHECFKLKNINRAANQPMSFNTEVGLCLTTPPLSQDTEGRNPSSYHGRVCISGASQSFIVQDVFC